MTLLRSDDQLDDCRTRLAADAYGSGVGSTSGGDDRSGRYWKVVDRTVQYAVEVALATSRPLLVTGDPGTGKSSLAPALAATLGWRFLDLVVTSRTQASDLMFDVDHLRRLLDAQRKDPKADSEENYLRPGKLWWALDPTGAKTLPSAPDDPSRWLHVVEPKTDAPTNSEVPSTPAVMLIDEIDKADPEVPNNLLVPFGSLEFSFDLPGMGRRVVQATERLLPLIVITSNGERELSDAFLRRCIKLHLDAPGLDDLRAMALGHVGEDAEGQRAVDLVAGLVGSASVPPAVFIDAVRACRQLSIDATSPHLELITGMLTATASDDGS